MKILLSHDPQMRKNYYGKSALDALNSLAEVRLNESETALTPEALIALAQDVDLIISDRLTTGPAAIFAQLPALKVFLRCAVDIRNIDVAAASASGILVTRAKPGFVESVAELTLGFLVDLARGISRTTSAYHSQRPPNVTMGRQLAGSTIGIIGYGNIARHLAPVTAALGMTVLIAGGCHSNS